MKPIAYMLVGVPGSGKSTWAEPYLARSNFGLVSSDAYIEETARTLGKTYGEIFKDTIDAATKWMNDQMEFFFKNLTPIVWDQTNLTMKSRRKKLDLLMAAGYDVVAVTFEIPDAELKKRREARAAVTGKTIPPSVLESMGATYQRPTRLEGFSKVIVVTPVGQYESNE